MVGMVGLIEDVDRHVTQDFKNEGDTIVLLGESKTDLSGSEYLYLVHKQKKGNPQIDIDKEKKLHETVLSAIDAGIINSAHDCSEGGLAVTLTESCVTNSDKMLGASVKLDSLEAADVRTDELLFGEAPSRIVVSVSKDNLNKLEETAKKNSVPCQALGEVEGDKLSIGIGDKVLIDAALNSLSDTWRNAIPSRL